MRHLLVMTISAIIISFILAQSDNSDNQPSQVIIKPTYKYTVWVGSSAISVGYDTNGYGIKDGVVRFKNSKGKQMTVPLTSVNHIEGN